MENIEKLKRRTKVVLQSLKHLEQDVNTSSQLRRCVRGIYEQTEKIRRGTEQISSKINKDLTRGET